MAYHTFRTRPFPGDWTYVWSDTGSLTTNWQLSHAGVTTTLSPISLGLRSILSWDSQYHQAVQLPGAGDLIPGQPYYLFNGGINTGIVYTIQLPLAGGPVGWLDPTTIQGDAAPVIQAKLQQFNIVHLAGGAYYLDSPINMTPGKTLRGFDATLVRNYSTGEPSLHQTPIFTLTPGDWGVLVEGIQFVANRRTAGQRIDESVVFAQNIQQTNPEFASVTLRRCVFRNVGLGVWNMPGLLADECAWIEGGNCNFASGPCLFLRCQFRDLAEPGGQQAWRSYGGFIGSGMALLDCDFIATDRGPIFQGNNSAIQFNLLSGVVCDRLAHVENGCEGVGLEGRNYALNSNLIFHLRYSGEGPGIIISDAAANDNIFRDFVIDGGFGIQIGSGDPTPLQQNNKFLDGEIRGGRFLLGTSATLNVMQTCSFIGPRPTRGSLFLTVPVTTNEAVIPNVAGNPGIDYVPATGSGTVKFSRLLDGWRAT